MKTLRNEIGKKCALLGGVAGLVLYALFGLLQGAVFGGTGGLLLVNWLFGRGAVEMMAGELITRVIIGGAMVVGVLVSLVMFLTISSVAGYVVGYAIGMMVKEESPAVTHTEAAHHA